MNRLLDLESIFKIATSGSNQNASLDSTLGILFKKISLKLRADMSRLSSYHSRGFFDNFFGYDVDERERLSNEKKFIEFVYQISSYVTRRLTLKALVLDINKNIKFETLDPSHNNLIIPHLKEKFPLHSALNFDFNISRSEIIKSSIDYFFKKYYNLKLKGTFEKYNLIVDEGVKEYISTIVHDVTKGTADVFNASRDPNIQQIINFIVNSASESFRTKYAAVEDSLPEESHITMPSAQQNPPPEVSQRATPPAPIAQQHQQDFEPLDQSSYESEFRVDDRHVADYEYLENLQSEDELENVAVSKIAALNTSKLEAISDRACDEFTKRLIDPSILIEDSSHRIIYEKFSNVMVAVIVCSSIAAYYGRYFESIQDLYDFFDKNNNLNADPFLFIKDAVVAYAAEAPSSYEGAFTRRNFKFFEREVAKSTDKFVTADNHLYLDSVKTLLSLFKVENHAPSPDLRSAYISTSPLTSNKEQLEEIEKMKFRFRSLKNLRDKATHKVIDVFNRMSDD
jgi:hypothetical protein